MVTFLRQSLNIHQRQTANLFDADGYLIKIVLEISIFNKIVIIRQGSVQSMHHVCRLHATGTGRMHVQVHTPIMCQWGSIDRSN